MPWRETSPMDQTDYLRDGLSITELRALRDQS